MQTVNFYQNIPFFCIIVSMLSGTVSSVLNGKWAKRLNMFVVSVVGILSAVLLYYLLNTGESFTYMMGHFPAPWGNEIRAGVLEALMALFFCIVMVLCLTGGRSHIETEVEYGKQNLYYILVNLLLSSLLALIYTNDLFTAYVFVEINTLAACGLIMIRQNGRTIEAATRYMIMSSLGSGLLLIGLCILYDCTGHLLMSNVKESVTMLVQSGTYHLPLVVAIVFICVGLAIKSALFPFHSWLPDAYGYSTTSSAAILSSLVSKGYIFLLIKIFYRVIGFNVICESKITNIFFVFGLCGMIFGSLSAIRENDIRRMIAFSSVAQIGYIYMGLGLGTTLGIVAAIFHIFSHAATKSMLFISGVGLSDVSGKSKKFIDLTGSGFRNPIAGFGFLIGSLSMVGIPLFSGFVSKLLFSQAGIQTTYKMLPTLICLAISTILNAIYFMKTVIRIYTPVNTRFRSMKWNQNIVYTVTILVFVVLNVALGMLSDPIVDMIYTGLGMFA
ncbi:MAG: complex I subunit 5 family protein [Lachnospiraceae bacterium]